MEIPLFKSRNAPRGSCINKNIPLPIILIVLISIHLNNEFCRRKTGKPFYLLISEGFSKEWWHGMLKQILGEFLNLEGVFAAVVVGRDGFVIESALSGKIDVDALGAMASTGIGTSEAMGKELGKGELTQLLVELDKGPIIISPLSRDELIAIVAESSSNLGRIRYELKKNKERLIAAL
jgi:hypothetical protein